MKKLLLLLFLCGIAVAEEALNLKVTANLAAAANAGIYIQYKLRTIV